MRLWRVRIFLRKKDKYISVSIIGKLVHVITSESAPETLSEKKTIYEGMCG